MQVIMTRMPSTNWFWWLPEKNPQKPTQQGKKGEKGRVHAPTKMTGPSLGMFSKPVTSMEEKKMDRMDEKNVFTAV